MFLVTVIIIVLASFKYSILINPEIIFDYPNQEPYRLHLFRIFEKYLDPGKTNFCIDCDELIHLIPRTVSLVTISRKDKKVNWPPYHKVDSYILDLTRETKERLEFVVKTPGWNPRAKFFIIYNKKSTSYLLKALFSKYIVDVAIFSSPDNSTLIIRTYDPFKNGKLRPKVLKTNTIATIATVTDSNRQIDLFPNKYPQKWNNITIDVLPVNSPPYIMIIPGVGLVGLDFLKLNAVGRRMGIKFNFLSNDMLNYWGVKGDHGKYSYAFGALQENKFSISAGAFQVSYPEYVDFDMAYPVMEDYLVMVVPTAPFKGRGKCIVDIFKKSLWASLLASILLMSSIFYIRSTKYDLSTSFLVCLATFLKIAISKMPKSNSQRLLLLFWITYCFIIDSYFECHLQGAFNVAHREKQIDSFEEIQQMGMKVAINKRSLQLFTNGVTPIDRFVSHNYFEINSSMEALNKSMSIGGNKNNVVIILERFIKYCIALIYVDPKDGSPTVHVLTKKLMFYPLTIYCAKGFPLFDGIERLLCDFKAIGYIEKLYSYDKHMKKIFYHKNGVDWKNEPLSLDDLKYVYWVLFAGLGVSSLILFLEIFWQRRFGTSGN